MSAIFSSAKKIQMEVQYHFIISSLKHFYSIGIEYVISIIMRSHFLHLHCLRHAQIERGAHGKKLENQYFNLRHLAAILV